MRKRADYSGPQILTRIPPYRPGVWVKVRRYCDPTNGDGVSGAVLRVKALTCSFSSPDQKRAVWRVHFDSGRCLEWHLIERMATPAEVAAAPYVPRRAA